MQQDKALVRYGGETAAGRSLQLLHRVCDDALLSVRQAQAILPAYADFPIVVDISNDIGPAASLLAAWERSPGDAWLVLAVDMPFVTEALLSALIGQRDTNALATGFVNEAGIPEPLCAIWEPAAGRLVAERHARGRHSLRAVLDAGPARLLPAANPQLLRSVDTPQAYAQATRELAESSDS